MGWDLGLQTCDATLGSSAVGEGEVEKKEVREENKLGLVGFSLFSSALRLVWITSRALPAMLYALHGNIHRAIEADLGVLLV